jgi:hypothetical protein
MGRQIKVYLHPEDHRAVEEFVREKLACTLVAERSRSRTPTEIDSSPEIGWSALICPVDSLRTIKPEYVEAQGYWLTSPTKHPVIEWMYSRLADDGIHPGRFYYVADHFGGARLPEPRDEAFVKTAERLFRWVQKTTQWVETGWGRERLGPVAAARHRAGGLAIHMNPA